MAEENNNLMEKIVSLAKRRGFVYQGSEIYGGLAGTWDYGPLGVTLKNNIKGLWWKRFVTDRENMYGVDAAILMNQNVWKASGHVAGFSDPMVECLNKDCKNRRHRVDHILSEESYKEVLRRLHDPEKIGRLVERITKETRDEMPKSIPGESYLGEDEHETRKGVEGKIEEFEKKKGVIMQTYLNENGIKCPGCSHVNWGTPKQFNMMFKTQVGASEDEASISYLRPETAQGIFVNFKNVVDSLHPKLPFGVAQIGKAFRNEIAPRDFVFRSREFEQMEVEYFIRPEAWESAFAEWQGVMKAFMTEIGLPTEHVHELEVAEADRAHYSKRTIDFEFDFPFGRKELYGLAYRTDYDLKSHMNESGVSMEYLDEETKQKLIPHVIEPSLGVDRTVLAILVSAYTEDELGGEKRVFLKLSPKVAPVKIAVFPLLKNKPVLVEKAREVYSVLKKEFGAVVFDDNGNIGKRYRRQDEIGTPFCVTVDFDTVEKDSAVTVRDRDTGTQERIAIADIVANLQKRLG